MTSTPSTAKSELNAVNDVLGAIGQSPVTTLEFNNPEVFLVYQLLQQVLTDTLSEGWTFNTDREIVYTPNQDGRIVIPPNVLQIDGSGESVNRSTDLVNRNGLLYDKNKNSNKFDGPVSVNQTVLVELDQLPIPFYRYVVAQASVRAASELVNSTDLYKLLTQTASQLRAALLEYECNTGDYSFFGTPQGTAYRPYSPYRALAR